MLMSTIAARENIKCGNCGTMTKFDAITHLSFKLTALDLGRRSVLLVGNTINNQN